MRVTRESLIRIAKETVQERAYNDKNIIAAYLTGSLLTEEPFLGGLFGNPNKRFACDAHISFLHSLLRGFSPRRTFR